MNKFIIKNPDGTYIKTAAGKLTLVLDEAKIYNNAGAATQAISYNAGAAPGARRIPVEISIKEA